MTIRVNVVVVAPTATGITTDSAATRLPTWNDEDNAYRTTRGYDVSQATVTFVDDGTWNSTQLSNFAGAGLPWTDAIIHGTNESDELWVSLRQVQRLEDSGVDATTWIARQDNLVDYFIDDFESDLGATELSNGYDHVVGWGLCEWALHNVGHARYNDAVAAINSLIVFMSSWDTRVPGSANEFDSGGRNMARHLRLAVAAVKVDANATNRAWRDQVVDLVMQSTDWDATYKNYFGPTYTNFSGNYAAGDRISATFHIGLLAEGMWDAWNQLVSEQDARSDSVKQRIIDIGSFYRDISFLPSGKWTQSMGYDSVGAELLNEDQDVIYTVTPINWLVFAYKLTGDVAYLNKAWSALEGHFANVAASWLLDSTPATNKVPTYIDSALDSSLGYQRLAFNKSQLQYTWALFENGGQPTVIRTLPSWYTAMNDKTWKAMNASNFPGIDQLVSASVDANQSFTINGNTQNAMESCTSYWCSAFAREDYYCFAAQGGHVGSSDNSVYEFGPLSSETPTWVRSEDPTDSAGNAGSDGYYSDGTPASRHGYNHSCYIPELGDSPESGRRWFAMLASGYYSDGFLSSNTASFAFTSEAGTGGSWEAQGTHPNTPNTGNINEPGLCEWDAGGRLVYAMIPRANNPVYAYDPVAKSWSTVTASLSVPAGGGAIDPVRKILVVVQREEATSVNGSIYVVDINQDDGNYGDVQSFNVSLTGNAPGIAFYPEGQQFVIYDAGSTIKVLDVPSDYRTGSGSTDNPLNASGSWAAIRTVTLGSGGDTPYGYQGDGDFDSTWGLFNYIPSIGGFCVHLYHSTAASANAYVFKPGGAM